MTTSENLSKIMDTATVELQEMNKAVLQQRRQLEAVIVKRNRYAYDAHRQGVSLGHLAQAMGLTRSAVQGMIRNVEAGEDWQA